MKRLLNTYFFSLPGGARLILLLYLLGFPLAYLGTSTHLFNLFQWTALVPSLIWHGQIWRLVTYAFIGGSVLDWVISLFWLATLIAVLARNWSSRALWGYCLLAIISAGTLVTLLAPNAEKGFVGCSAMIFALLVAWDRLYRHERLIMLGIGEISVRQAAIFIAIIDALILLFCPGWFIMLCMMSGGLVGWLYFTVSSRSILSRTSQTANSERIARLEL